MPVFMGQYSLIIDQRIVDKNIRAETNSSPKMLDEKDNGSTFPFDRPAPASAQTTEQ
ncbi:hypothetical protein PilKf_01161 [Pillotina sp. SPG140]